MLKKLLKCPACSSTFRISPEAIGDDGRAVRCSQCSHEWLANRLDLLDISEQQPEMNPVEVSEMMEKAAAAYEAPQAEELRNEFYEELSKIAETAESRPTDIDSVIEANERIEPEIREEFDFSIFRDLDSRSNAPSDEEVQAERVKRIRRLLLTANVACFILMLAVGVVTLRQHILAVAPFTKPLYAALGYVPTDSLKLDQLSFSRNNSNKDTKRYIVRGNIINQGTSAIDNVIMRARLFSKNGELLDEWEIPVAESIAPNATYAFTTKGLRSSATNANVMAFDIGSPIELMLRK